MANYKQNGYDPSQNGFWRGVRDDAPNFGYPQNYYYADTIRSIMIAFGNFFNDMYVVRRTDVQEPGKVIRVPLTYGPRKKSHDFRTEQETGNTAVITYPNMTYKIDSYAYDSTRETGTYETRAFYANELKEMGIENNMAETYWADTQPAPVTINVSMEINCENIDDLNQIVEAIIPHFRPAAYVSIREFWFFNKRRSIKIKMDQNGVQIDNDAMGEEDKRIIKGTISFTIEAFMYKPIKNAQIIEKINMFLSYKTASNTVIHNQIFGNKTGDINGPRFNMSNIYGAKVGHVYVLDEEPKTVFDAATSAYTTTYKYAESDKLMMYEKGSKLLVKTVCQWSPADKPIYTTEELYDAENYRYYTSAVPHINEWVTTKEYVDLNGWGKNTDGSIEFGMRPLYDRDGNLIKGYYSSYSETDTIENMHYSFNPKTHDLTYSGKYDKSGM